MAKKYPETTKAREKADLLEFERMHPLQNAAIDNAYEYRDRKDLRRSMIEAEINAAEADRNENARVGRKPRSEEDMAELAREVSRFESKKGGMRKGGMVKKSKPKATKSRGDGIAQRGKTKGRMI